MGANPSNSPGSLDQQNGHSRRGPEGGRPSKTHNPGAPRRGVMLAGTCVREKGSPVAARGIRLGSGYGPSGQTGD